MPVKAISAPCLPTGEITIRSNRHQPSFLSNDTRQVQDTAQDNQLRPYMSCGNLTPAQAHAEIKPLVKKWKGRKNSKAKSVLL